MSADRFRQALALMNLSENELVWYPKRVDGYAGFHAARELWEHGVGELPLDQESVIAYLRSLRDAGIAAWRRHQAARALEIYQATVLRNSIVDFRPIRKKLQEIASTEKRTGGVTSTDAALVDGEALLPTYSVMPFVLVSEAEFPLQPATAQMRRMRNP